MSDSWIEAIVQFKDSSVWENKREIALEFIRPTVKELWKERVIEFFHYFFEPELHLRLYSKKKRFKEIEGVVKSNLKPIKHLLLSVYFNSYHGESESFFNHTGRKDAWYLGRDFFMENSGTALHFLEILDKKTLFNPMNWMFDRFLHSFCNELGFSNIEEGEMLFEYSIHRATIEARKKKDRKGTERILNNLKQKLQSLTTKLLQQ
ncbi:MAG: hypothetical protein JSV51_05610 [Candidatus Bathyarchaeota archaeon]|nr:MAG: hypothetical protein JSV51_05610 [Candidatus Bathyarchaeota archaeon]